MIAYRLHFERASLEATEIVQSGTIGRPRLFTSVFRMQARPRNVPFLARLGGSPLYDVALGCIDVARNVFRAEPIEVLAMISHGQDGRFREAEEGASVILRFPDDRLASLSCSFGSSDVSCYRIMGTRGELRVEPRYELEDLERSDRAPTGDKSIDDVVLLEAIFESAASGRPVTLEPARRRRRPTRAPANPAAASLRAAPPGTDLMGPTR